MGVLGIFGANGHGRVVADLALSSGFKKVLFFDDKWPEITSSGPWPVVGDFEALKQAKDELDAVIVAVGNNHVRVLKAKVLSNLGFQFTTLIHPSAVVSAYANVSEGSVVLPGAVLNFNARVGKHCIVNSNATVEHDCVLADGVHISPGASLAGGVSVGFCAWVGIGAVVKQLINIGKEVVVGAGAVVTQSILDQLVVVGVPAKPLPKKECVHG